MRKVFLIICIAFVVLCYGFPCFVLPFGTYKHEDKVEGVQIETSYKFKFDGTVALETKIGDASQKFNYYYKIKDGNIILSMDKNFEDAEDVSMPLTSIYKIGEAVNTIGMYTAIGIGIAALVLVITIPGKKE